MLLLQIRCIREENTALGTTDWRRPPAQGYAQGPVVLRIAESERPQLVVQLGAGDAINALEAAQLVADRVAAVDLNMGCPMEFSTSGGMGSALLRAPDTAADILQTLRRNLSVPITCKIRLLSSTAETVELARRLEACGVAAVAVHCREVQQRSRTPARWDELRPLVDALNVPVVANGDVVCFDDFEKVRAETGCHSVMAARGALWNCSIFRSEGFADLHTEVIPRYTALAARWSCSGINSTRVVNDMRAAGRRGRVRRTQQ